MTLETRETGVRRVDAVPGCHETRFGSWFGAPSTAITDPAA